MWVYLLFLRYFSQDCFCVTFFYIYYPFVLLLIYFLVIIPKTLNRDHGYPLRVVVPGIIGARSVKWIDSINIIAEECQVGHALLIFEFFLMVRFLHCLCSQIYTCCRVSLCKKTIRCFPLQWIGITLIGQAGDHKWISLFR